MVGRYCAKNFTDMKSFNIYCIFGGFFCYLKIPKKKKKEREREKKFKAARGGKIHYLQRIIKIMDSFSAKNMSQI